MAAPPAGPLGSGREFDIIRRILADNAAADGRVPDHVLLGPGDDCAVVSGSGLCISVDMSVEDVHFRRDWLQPDQIGYRAVMAALSDLAAMAAMPVGVLVALACPQDADEESFVASVMRGAGEACSDVGAALLGGDITRIPGPAVIDVVVIGNTDRPALRRGARPGDEIWVTGRLGAAAAAVRDWNAGYAPDPNALRAFARPVARVAEARWLAGRGLVNALIDLSDGLAGDAGHIAAASGVQIVLEAARIPVHSAVHAAAADADDALALALHGGDDYELCFAAPPGLVEAAAAAFSLDFGIPLTRVGTVHAGSGTLLRAADGDIRPVAGGYDHFATGRDA